jgi:hypothetical protein
MEPDRGGPKFIFAGFLPLAIMGTLLWQSIFTVSGFPVTPCREGLSCGLDKALGIASVSVMLLLVFLVLDEFRLTIYWVKGLTKFKRMNWSGVGGKEREGLGDQIRDLVHERLKIGLVAE